jgi:hypothetical protein
MKIENRIQGFVGTRAVKVKGERAEYTGAKGSKSVGSSSGLASVSQSGRGQPHSKTWRSSADLDLPLANTDGFWELSFAGQLAVLPQHQGLFFVAFLLANPHGAPIPAVDLANEVFERYGEHEDFRPPIPEYLRDHSRVAKILLRKEKRLERVVDRDGEEDFVRIEALRELMVLDELKRIYFSEIAREAKDAGKIVSEALRELHATLASAVDIRGEPHPLIRDFAMHLLHYVLMPSERVSAREGVKLFVYKPA